MTRKDKLLREVSRKRQKDVCFQAPVPIKRHCENSYQFALFFLQDNGKDDSERKLFGQETIKI